LDVGVERGFRVNLAATYSRRVICLVARFQLLQFFVILELTVDCCFSSLWRVVLNLYRRDGGLMKTFFSSLADLVFAVLAVHNLYFFQVVLLCMGHRD